MLPLPPLAPWRLERACWMDWGRWTPGGKVRPFAATTRMRRTPDWGRRPAEDEDEDDAPLCVGVAAPLWGLEEVGTGDAGASLVSVDAQSAAATMQHSGAMEAHSLFDPNRHDIAGCCECAMSGPDGGRWTVSTETDSRRRGACPLSRQHGAKGGQGQKDRGCSGRQQARSSHTVVPAMQTVMAVLINVWSRCGRYAILLLCCPFLPLTPLLPKRQAKWWRRDGPGAT